MEKTLWKIAFLYFASQYESISKSMHESITNLNLSPGYVVNAVKLSFYGRENLFQKHGKISSFSYVYSAKNLYLLAQMGQGKGQILVPFKLKIKGYNVTFKGMLTFCI